MNKLAYKSIFFVLLIGLMFGLMGVANAANDVTTESGASIVLPSDSSSYTLGTDTTVQSFTVNNSSIDFVVEASSIINLTSGDRRAFEVSNSADCSLTTVCGASSSNVKITCASGIAPRTITVTPGGFCYSGGGTSSSSGGASYTPPVTPVVTPVTPVTPVVPPTTVVPLASVAPSASTLTVQPASVIEFSNPASAVLIKGLTSPVFQQGSALKFSYQFKNENSKTIPVKITRQLINSSGKVIQTSVSNTNLKQNQTLKKTVAETISKTLPPGDYTEIIKIVNSKTKESLEENSFNITVEKLKKKYFILAGEIPGATAIAFDEAIWNKVKSDIVLPANFKFKYSYTNDTAQKQTIKMVRELIGPNEKVVSKNSGKWTMKPGEKFPVVS